MRKVEFFKGDRELSLWYIPTAPIWLFVVTGEAARVFSKTPEQITLMILFFLPPNHITLLLDLFVQDVLIATVFYVAFRYLSKWLVFILVPLFGVVDELIACRGDIATFAAHNRMPQSMVIPFWAVFWLFVLTPPYFIIKLEQWKRVPVLLIAGGIGAFLTGGELPGPGLGGFMTLLLSPLLIASGVVYYWYKRRQRKTKK